MTKSKSLKKTEKISKNYLKFTQNKDKILNFTTKADGSNSVKFTEVQNIP